MPVICADGLDLRRAESSPNSKTMIVRRDVLLQHNNNKTLTRSHQHHICNSRELRYSRKTVDEVEGGKRERQASKQ